jgi:predicted component of type VI protein secretion system
LCSIGGLFSPSITSVGRWDRGDQPGREREVADDRRVIHKGVRDRFRRRAERRLAQLDDDFRRDPDRLSLVELDRIASATGGDQPGEPSDEIRRQRCTAVID